MSYYQFPLFQVIFILIFIVVVFITIILKIKFYNLNNKYQNSLELLKKSEEFSNKEKLYNENLIKIKTDEFLKKEKLHNEEFFYQKKLYEDLKALYEKELGFRKSSEVRLGKIGESLAPFLNDWPWDSNKFHFIGNPIDGIQFNEDEIIFIEIKTGKARLSDCQKNIKELINNGRISFITFRIGENGCVLD